MGRYRRKSYPSEVLCDPNITFLEEEKSETFHAFVYWILFIDYVAISKKYVVKFPCLPNFDGYILKASSFSVIKDFNTSSIL